jgi:hypothetical protein
MNRHKLDTATAWIQSVLDSTGRDYPKVSFSLREGQGDSVYDLIVEGSQRRINVGLDESILHHIADGNEAIRNQVAKRITGLARDSEWIDSERH